MSYAMTKRVKTASVQGRKDQLNITFVVEEENGVTGAMIKSEVIETLPKPPPTRGAGDRA